MIQRKHLKCSTLIMMGETEDMELTEPVYVDIFSVISADELMKVMISLGNPRTETEIKVGRGDQLSSISLSLSLQEMIAEEDPDGDGVITKDEFKKMLQKKQSDMIK